MEKGHILFVTLTVEKKKKKKPQCHKINNYNFMNSMGQEFK